MINFFIINVCINIFKRMSVRKSAIFNIRILFNLAKFYAFIQKCYFIVNDLKSGLRFLRIFLILWFFDGPMRINLESNFRRMRSK